MNADLLPGRERAGAAIRCQAVSRSFAGTGLVAAATCVLAAFLTLARLAPGHRWVLAATLALLAVGAVLIVANIWLPDAWGLTRAGMATSSAGIWAVVLGSAYGLTDEIHQAFVPGRSADPRDWVADTAGAVLGALLAVAYLRRREARARLDP